MDGEEFFDRLYSHYYVHFPCFALYDKGRGFVTEPAVDGSAAVVVLTDADLAGRYVDRRGGRDPLPVELRDAKTLAWFLGQLPPAVTHVTFDPAAKFHRRFPVSAIRSSLPQPAGRV